jgi:hypothetical protein
MTYLQRRGTLAKNPDGSYVIMTEGNRGIKVEMAIMVVWDMCDGTRTEQDILRDLAERMGTSQRKLSKTVPLIIQKLRGMGLIY